MKNYDPNKKLFGADPCPKSGCLQHIHILKGAGNTGLYDHAPSHTRPFYSAAALHAWLCQCAVRHLEGFREPGRSQRADDRPARRRDQSTGQHPAPDPIFYLAGGPGFAATEDAAQGQQFPYSLSENHDLVFVDQRGTGGSNRVLVPTNPPDFTGLTPAEMDSKAKEWVAQYLSEMDMDPRFYTTSAAMEDLDEVREALGYDKINLFGASYGATAAQYYLRQHEDHVRTVFLYGGSLLDTPVFERWALSGQRALDMIFDHCQADPACQAAYPNLRAEFKELLTRLEAQPVTVNYTNPSDSAARGRHLHPRLFRRRHPRHDQGREECPPAAASDPSRLSGE